VSNFPYEDEALLTPSEVAAIMSVDAKTVTRWARGGRFPRVPGDDRPTVVRTPGGHTRIRAVVVRKIRDGEIQINWGDDPVDMPGRSPLRERAS
jgi:hypothetical protein